MQNEPFKAKPEEPDDDKIVIPTLDSLINSTKGEGIDELFSKQNQYGAQHPGGAGFGGATTPSINQGNVFDFGELTPAGASNNFTLGGNDGMQGGGDLDMRMTFGNRIQSIKATPTPISSIPFPKPPEKTAEQPKKKPLNFGTLTGLNLGQKNKSEQQHKPANSNYDAFDDLTGGLSSGGNNSSAFGGTAGMDMTLGSTINSQQMNTQDLMGTFGGSSSNNGVGMGMTFGNEFNSGMGMGGLSMNSPQQTSSDPFQRGMGGLMNNSNSSGGIGNMTFGSNTMGLGGMGGMSNMGGMGGMSNMGGMGSFGQTPSNNGMMDFDMLGGSNTFGNSGGMGTGQFGNSQQNKPQSGGILSNPNLTFKNTNQKPPHNNFNDFDLL